LQVRLSQHSKENPQVKAFRTLMLCFSVALIVLASIGSASAQALAVLHTFQGGAFNDGAESLGVVLDPSGTVFGSAPFGGSLGAGTIYRFGRDGSYATLHNFAGGATDGAFPNGGMLLQKGVLTGTTLSGGNGPCQGGCGTVFRLSSGGRFVLVHTFLNDANGGVPSGSLASDSEGNIFGETQVGGNVSGKCFSVGGCGTIFRIDATTGRLSTVHQFRWTDGTLPFAGLVTDSNGNLFGIAEEGGANLCKSGIAPAPGCGTLFKVDAAGNFSLLHVFKQTDGQFPIFLTIDSSGNLFGTTLKGGASGLGEVFKFDSQGNFSVIHSFSGSDGELPGGVIASNGKIFGAVGAGGDLSACSGTPQGCGVIFEMDSDGSNFQLLHTFENSTDGASPYIFLGVDHAGRLYGTTTAGGILGDTQVCGGVGCGVLYMLTP
jgi:uncharacterized repeat protein (TIGR03803 family)